MSILTTPPNPFFAQFHDRQAVVVDLRDADAWLACDPTEAKRICAPLDAGRFSLRLVSPRINAAPRSKTGDDDPACLETTAGTLDQAQLGKLEWQRDKAEVPSSTRKR